MTMSNIGSAGGADVTFRRYDAVSARRIRAVVAAMVIEFLTTAEPPESVQWRDLTRRDQ